MKLTLVGYMGSGKSTIGFTLAQKLNINFIDLDEYIEILENSKISTIFKEKGEIYFRKLENKALKSILSSDKNFVLSLGGGTPVYYNSIELINEFSESFYLNITPKELTNRLKKERNKRPLISHLNDDELLEFIAKHLFERSYYYAQSKYTIKIADKNIETITDEIIQIVNQL